MPQAAIISIAQKALQADIGLRFNSADVMLQAVNGEIKIEEKSQQLHSYSSKKVSYQHMSGIM